MVGAYERGAGGDRICEQIHVPNFASGPRRLGVVVEMRAFEPEYRSTIRQHADRVHHGAIPACCCCTERQARDGANVVFELARHRTFDGVMPRVMDPRCELVGDETVADLK